MWCSQREMLVWRREGVAGGGGVVLLPRASPRACPASRACVCRGPCGPLRATFSVAPSPAVAPRLAIRICLPLRVRVSRGRRISRRVCVRPGSPVPCTPHAPHASVGLCSPGSTVVRATRVSFSVLQSVGSPVKSARRVNAALHQHAALHQRGRCRRRPCVRAPSSTPLVPRPASLRPSSPTCVASRAAHNW